MTSRRALLGALHGVMWLMGACVRATLVSLPLALAGLWLWCGTQASLDWAWQRWAQPRGFVADGLTGSLREGLRAQRLQVQAGALRLDLQAFALSWDPLSLLDRRVRITDLRAGRMQLLQQAGIDDASQILQALPASLIVPIDLRIDHLAIDRFIWAGPLPLQADNIAAHYRYDGAQGEHILTLTHVTVASGRYHGQASLGDRAPFVLQAWGRGEVQAAAPGAPMPMRLAAQADASGTLTDLQLRLQLGLANTHRQAPAADAPSAQLQARLRPWQVPRLTHAQAQVRHLDLALLWPQAPHTALTGRIDITPQAQARWKLQADLANARAGPWDQQRLPLSSVHVQAQWREGMAWVQRLQAHIGARGEGGQVQGEGQWLAPRGWRLALRLVRVRLPALHSALGREDDNAAPGLEGQLQVQMQADRLTLQGQAQGGVRLSVHQIRVALAAQAELGAGVHAPWQARIDHLRITRAHPHTPAQTWVLQLQAPLRLQQESAARWVIDAGQAALTSPAGPGAALLAWDRARWGAGQLLSSGRVSELPMSWLVIAGRGPPPGDMVFEATWNARLADTPQISARLAQVRGDITLLAENAQGQPVRMAAGVREASLTLESRGESLALALRWASERAGRVEGQITSRLTRGGPIGWQWPAQAALSGQVQARLPRIAAWSALAPPGWRLRGSLAADIHVGGTRAAPLFSGPLQADDLVLRSVVDGIALEGGRLRARLDDRRVVIDELAWQSPDPAVRPTGGGTLRARGHASWVRAQPGRPAGLYAQLDAQLDRLRASVRRDRQVTVSGAVSAGLEPERVSLQGDLRVDRARITVSDTPMPRLGADVRVRHPPPGAASAWESPAPSGARALRLDVRVDLGRDARVSGRGVDTGVQGSVRVSGNALTQPRLVGEVYAVDGHYQAYGQRLDLQRGVLRFTGAYDDPVLDVLAVRSDLDRPVGVQVTGRAQAPILRLWSQEPATEAEKLAWLVLGRSAAAGGSETMMLEQAALSLLARRAGLGVGGLASVFGLDELSVRREGEQGAAITLGKRLARKLYAAYERSLSGALGTLQIFYDLSARLTLRAQAGDRSGVDLVYALSFDQIGGPTAPVQGRPMPRR